MLERELGGGAMSRVFLARETALGRTIVLKLLPPELAESLSADRFHREIQLAASLQHPHIVPLLAAGRVPRSGGDGELLFYTMPLVEGESLRARLAREGELPVDEAVRVLRDVADALSYAHRHGVVHRDIKPDNVLLSDDHALVTDFGVAKALDEAQDASITGTGLALGTPSYMAPEQAAADPHTDYRADIYAVGVLGYEMLAGRPPFTGPSAQAIVAAHLTQSATPLHELRPSVPPALALLIMRCLEKRPADRWQRAGDLLHALQSFATPATGIETVPKPTARSRRPALAALTIGLIAAAGGWLFLQRSDDAPSLEDDLIAVAPFDVPDARLALWREGLVDVLSRNLDGAGPVRSVPSTVVIRRWTGRADRPSAAALGRRTGARLVVFGTLTGTGPDSARLTASAFDVAENRSVAELELRDGVDRVDRLADSLTVRLLRELGRTRRIEVRTASIGTSSLPALKAFLRGEQWFRQSAWDSALAAYDAAIATDSGFALALWRSGQVMGWTHWASDSISVVRSTQAGALNRGLAPRDSLLVAADSILGGLYGSIPRVSWPALRRVEEIAGELTRRYPDDAESWFLVGEIRYHWGVPLGASPRGALDAFDRAIRSDSTYTPSFIHAVELGYWLGGQEAGRRYGAQYLSLQPADASAEGIRLADQLMAPGTRPEEAEHLVREAAPSELRDAGQALEVAADSAEWTVRLTRALAAAPPGDAPWLGPQSRERAYGISLLYRGHVREALDHLLGNPAVVPIILVEAALVSPAPTDSMDRVFRRLAGGDHLMPVAATLPWWAARRDSAALRAIGHRSDSAARSAPEQVDREIATYISQAAQAYLVLLRHDTAAAVQRLESLPDSLCSLCYAQNMTLGHLYAARQEDRKAAALLDRFLINLTLPSAVLQTLERARVAERLGEREKALWSYKYVADVWRRADPELQPYVAEAKEGLARLTSEPR